MQQKLVEKKHQTRCGTIHYWVSPIWKENEITLVFLPGLTADHRLFYKQLEYFDKKYNVLVWDAPAHAASWPFSFDFNLKDKAIWLNEIMEKEDITQPVIIGQSMGAYVGQMYAELFGEKLKGFVSIDSAPLQRKYVTAVEIWLLKRMEPVYRYFPWRALLVSGTKGVSTTRYGRKLMLKMMKVYDGQKERYAKISGHGFKMLAEAMEYDLPYEITCPALLICGKKDQAGSCVRYNKAWHKNTGIPLEWIDDAGHNSNTDKPEYINALIEELICEIQEGGTTMKKRAIPGIGGNKYIPYEERTGEESLVYFTRDLSPAGLKKIYDKVAEGLTGNVAIKLHTGEAEGPNIIPRPWVKELYQNKLPEATIVETNTYYEGSRYTTEAHRETLQINGWTFCPVDITDEHGVATLPVIGGKWFDEMHVGEGLLKYDSLLALTHFKGHTQGGMGGSNKNIGIGCADGRIGKMEIHTTPGQDNMWDIGKEEFMERMTESTKATIDHFAGHVSFINVMRNMSVSCDCEGKGAEPVMTPDVGILASYDILAVDNACVDMLYNLPGEGGKHMIERVETRHGLRQLSYMKELGMGNDKYILIDLDHDEAQITAAEAVKDIDPEWTPDEYNTFPGRNKIRYIPKKDKED